jgi:hypothetical protein
VPQSLEGLPSLHSSMQQLHFGSRCGSLHPQMLASQLGLAVTMSLPLILLSSPNHSGRLLHRHSPAVCGSGPSYLSTLAPDVHTCCCSCCVLSCPRSCCPGPAVSSSQVADLQAAAEGVPGWQQQLARQPAGEALVGQIRALQRARSRLTWLQQQGLQDRHRSALMGLRKSRAAFLKEHPDYPGDNV